MDRKFIKNISIFLVVILQGCHQSQAPSQIEKERFNKNVVEAYDRYLAKYKSRTPPNLDLVITVTNMGKDGREYALYRAESADITEFQAILAVLSSYRRDCSENEYKILRKAALNLSGVADARTALLSYVDVACHGTPPAGWQ